MKNHVIEIGSFVQVILQKRSGPAVITGTGQGVEKPPVINIFSRLNCMLSD